MIYEEYEQKVTRKALQLSQGMPAAYNIAPLMQLIRDAWGLGYDVSRKPLEQLQRESVLTKDQA